ncbi:hypothetical protein ILUMI_04973 [Ignelater luminosus]|uniref:Ionotropic receptor n=1 Tax=Ignelater luminosus TaxID=2038154 RepID=A0A8K0GE13_IGNLU|nr:hypothetical protein ILUMI_04973 [Ignelater luminosus]
MKYFKILVATILFTTIGTFSKLSSQSRLQGNISHLIQKLFLPEETLQFIYEGSDNHNQLLNIPNPYTITKINKSIKGVWQSYNTYIIFTTNQTSFSRTLIKLQDSPLWDQSNSPRGRFIVITSKHIDTNFLTDTFSKYDIIDFSLIQKIQNTPRHSVKYAISDLNRLENAHQLCYSSKSSMKEQEIKMIIPNPVNISTTKLIELKALYVLALENLNMIGKLFKMKASYLFTDDIKTFLYNNSNDIYVYLSMTRPEMLFSDYDVSNYFYRDHMVWAVPLPDKMSTFKTIATTLDVKVWLIIIILLMVKSILWWLFSKLFKAEIQLFDLLTYILTSFLVTLGGSYNSLPHLLSLKVLLLFYLAYSMQISTIFQGELYSGLKNPKMEHGITNMKELADSPLPMMGSNQTKNTLTEHSSNNPIFAKVLKKLVVRRPLDLTLLLTYVARFKNCSTTLGKGALLYVLPKFKPLVNLIERNTGPLELEVSFAVRKGHHLLTVLNKYCRRLWEGGVYQKLFADATALYGNDEIEHKPDAFAFGIYHIYELFIMWAMGMLLAIVIFILEMYFRFCLTTNTT